MANNSELKFSVLIPARNEEANIIACLSSLRAQTISPERFEIIVVDNGSTDNTLSLAREQGVKTLCLPEANLPQLRNAAAALAEGEILAYLDADCLAEADWLEKAELAFSEGPQITGCECRVPAQAGWLAKAWFCLLPEQRQRVNCIGTANFLIDKKTFTELGGFNERLLTGEDCELCQRAAGKVPIISDPALRVLHLGVPNSLLEFCKREVWHGQGALGCLNAGKLDKPLIGTIAFILALILLPFASAPSLALLASLLIASCFYRRQYLRDAKHALELCLLFFFFYLGRAIGLLKVLYQRGRKGS